MFPSDYFGHDYFPPPYFADLTNPPPPTADTTGIPIQDLQAYPVLFAASPNAPLDEPFRTSVYFEEEAFTVITDDGKSFAIVYVQPSEGQK